MNEQDKTFIHVEPLTEKKNEVSENVPENFPENFIEEGDYKYEVKEPESLRLNDIARNDRAFVTTQSGTEFLIRYSTREGGYKIYSRSYDMIKGLKLYEAPNSSSLLVDKHQPMRFVTENQGDSEHPHVVWNTSPVEEIKIIKNIDDDANARRVLTIGGLK